MERRTPEKWNKLPPLDNLLMYTHYSKMEQSQIFKIYAKLMQIHLFQKYSANSDVGKYRAQASTG